MKISIVYKSIFVLIIFALSILACGELLEENPKDQVFVENFFETENDGIAAINSIYGVLNATSSGPNFGGVYFSTYWVAMGVCSDEMINKIPVTDLVQLNDFKHTPVNNSLYEFWTLAYKGINNANFAINGIPSIKADQLTKNRLIGEGRYLRAMLYFDLVRWFGDIPLILSTSNELRPPRNTKAEIYTKIIEDLSYSEQNLPDSYPIGNGLGRATKGAASALLAKVYLYQKEWKKCIDQCDVVIASGKYGLYKDFAEAFRIPNENGKESIFSVGFGTANNSISFWEAGQFNVRLLPTELKGQIPGVNANGWQIATQNLYDSYDAKDRRREVTLLTTINNKDGSTTTVDPHIQKYWDRVTEPSAGNTDHDFPYLRYSDILLLKAEAINELNNGPNTEAFDAINQVRKRARFNGTIEQNILPDLQGLSYQEFKDALLKERRWEFVAEGHRWFDLVRFEKLESLVPIAKPGVQPQPYHNLFPLPQGEIDLNPNLLPQNQGY